MTGYCTSEINIEVEKSKDTTKTDIFSVDMFFFILFESCL